MPFTLSTSESAKLNVKERLIKNCQRNFSSIHHLLFSFFTWEVWFVCISSLLRNPLLFRWELTLSEASTLIFHFLISRFAVGTSGINTFVVSYKNFINSFHSVFHYLLAQEIGKEKPERELVVSLDNASTEFLYLYEAGRL